MITTLGAVILIAAFFPTFLLVAAFSSVIAAIVVGMYDAAVVRYSDIENEASEPLVTLLHDLLAGGQVIRTFSCKDTMLTRGGEFIERLGAANMANYTLERWLGSRLEMIAALMLFATSLFCATGSITPSLAGLAISNAMGFGGLLAYIAVAISSVLTNLAAVARVDSLGRVPPEEDWPEPGILAAPPAKTGVRPPPEAAVRTALSAPRRSPERIARYPYAGWDPDCWDQRVRNSEWPKRGAVSFDNVTARYAVGLPAVLRSITVTVRGRSSLGVVGRSGSGKETGVPPFHMLDSCVLCRLSAGKSSFGLLLLRLIEADAPSSDAPASERVYIDGVDIGTLPLSQLRTAVSSVPQEPVLISGLTIAQNLDPTETVAHDVLWEALSECGIKDVISALPQGLNTPVGEGGADRLTTGQQQLLCFARVLSRKPRVVLLDEATSSLDAASGDIVQQLILVLSRRATIINIAHRLQSSE